ncbi:MAG: hypothetical protein DKM24_03300 [Candidatus Melainabacteria bacterium]|nr:MAG: hypothetical protein DKM24_03300 [Candidatus Melainabacteria bacterium]
MQQNHINFSYLRSNYNYILLISSLICLIPEIKAMLFSIIKYIKNNWLIFLLNILGTFFITYPILDIFVYKQKEHSIVFFIIGSLILLHKKIFKDFSYKKCANFLKETFESIELKDAKIKLRNMQNQVDRIEKKESNLANKEYRKNTNDIRKFPIPRIVQPKEDLQEFLNRIAHEDSKVKIIELWLNIDNKIIELATICKLPISQDVFDTVGRLKQKDYIKEEEFKLIFDFYNVKNQVINNKGKSLDDSVINIGIQIVKFLDSRIFITNDKITKEIVTSELNNMQTSELFKLMDNTIVGRPQIFVEHSYFIKKSIEEIGIEKTFERLTANFDIQPIFRKDQIFCGACEILQKILKNTNLYSDEFKNNVIDFVKRNRDGNISQVNRVEALYVRLTDKLMVLKEKQKLLDIFKLLDLDISKNLNFQKCIKEYSLTSIYDLIQDNQRIIYDKLSNVEQERIINIMQILSDIEISINDEYNTAYKQLPDSKQFLAYGFAQYAEENTQPIIYHNILRNLGITENFKLNLKSSN